MYCPRLDHFVRLNANGTLGRCGHMTKAPGFSSLHELDNSEWLRNIKQQFSNDAWPAECQRCKDTEELSNTSIRLDSIEFDKTQSMQDYLIVGGTLDNICNSACQTCSANLSTKIGSLTEKKFIKINNSKKFWSLPQSRIVQLDVNGGEPSASKNYKDILANLPPNVKTVRINTNCSKVMPEISDLLSRGIHVIVTVSLDGIGKIHDYVRWPIKFTDFERNLKQYQKLGVELNTWTTVSALNIVDFKNILKYVKEHKLQHSWALLEQPNVLSVKHSNHLTRKAKVPVELEKIVACGKDNSVELQLFTNSQDIIRGIKLWDYYNEAF